MAHHGGAAAGQPKGNGSVPGVNTFIYEARISNAADPATRQISLANVSGRAIHQGGICDSGTTCVLTGQDRRLGDYFTNSIDAGGCVVIASGDTTVLDSVTGQPRITSLPIYMKQTSGPSLTTGADCALAISTPEFRSVAGLLMASGLAAFFLVTVRRRRRRVVP
jgi:hypothetical protein